MSASPIPREIALQAAEWFVHLQDPQASAEAKAKCMAWRASHPQHERAWQFALHFQQQLHHVPAEIALPALDRPRSPDRRRLVKVLSILLMSGTGGLLAQQNLPWQSWKAEQRTATGEQRRQRLSDGSLLHMNTGTALDIAFSRQQRVLHLHQGEIMLEAHDDPLQRPFLVQTTAGRVLTLGAQVLVRRFDQQTRVGVQQGTVVLGPDASPESLRLSAGQQASMQAQGASSVTSLAYGAGAWVHGELQVERQALADFIAELGRYRSGILRCDPAIAQLEISGTFQLDDTDRILQALAHTLPVHVSYRTRYWVNIDARHS